MTALLLSASKEGNTEYLEHALPFISKFIAGKGITTALFLPFAGVSINYDDYTSRVQQALQALDINIQGLHSFEDPKTALLNAELIIVGGGNTFELLNQLYVQELIEPIKQSVKNGCLYIGWSAGSNIAGQSIRTTNDMPIVQPESFNALGFVPFQINPHYTDHQPPGHHGETRQMRIEEFMVLNPTTAVVGIQEGSALLLEQNQLTLVGSKSGYVFKRGEKQEIAPLHDLSELLN